MPRLAIVLKGYPRLSETFIAQEIRNLERAGFDLLLVSLRHPTDVRRHPVHAEIRAPVTYLPEYLWREPLRVIGGWWKSRRLPGYRVARSRFLADVRRDFTPNRIRRFGQALVLAAELPADIPALYAHFLHTPASVTRYTAVMRGMSWACSAHARDIYTSAEWDLREKLAECQWITTCTAGNVGFLRSLAREDSRVMLNYHGLDLDRFPPNPEEGSSRDGSDADDPVRLLSVGRMVEKKGYAGLLRALSMLPATLHWRLTHVGGGPLTDELRRQADAAGLGGKIEWLGALDQEAVLIHYRSADLFVLNSRIDADGDRDGLPNVLVEAQSQGLAVVATTLSGIPELIQPGINGELVPPEDDSALAVAIERLVTDPQQRRVFGAAGQQRVRTAFDMDAAFAPLATRLLELTENQASIVRSTNQ